MSKETERKIYYVDFTNKVVTNEVTIIDEPQPSVYEGWPDEWEDLSSK